MTGKRPAEIINLSEEKTPLKEQKVEKSQPKVTISISKSKLKGLDMKNDTQKTEEVIPLSGPSTTKKSKNLSSSKGSKTEAPEAKLSPKKERGQKV